MEWVPSFYRQNLITSVILIACGQYEINAQPVIIAMNSVNQIIVNFAFAIWPSEYA